MIMIYADEICILRSRHVPLPERGMSYRGFAFRPSVLLPRLCDTRRPPVQQSACLITTSAAPVPESISFQF